VPAVVHDPEKYVAAMQIEILLTPAQTVLRTKARDDLDGMVTEIAKVKVGYIVEIQGVSSGAGHEGTARSREVTSLVVPYLSVDHAVPVYRIYVVGAGVKALATSDREVEAPGTNRGDRIEVLLLKRRDS
jgi:hypothetical protein